jgi:putative endonuclease
MLWFPGKRKKLLSNPKLLGQWGEKRCENFLKSNGYKFIARNYSCKTGEIDLIFSSESGSIVFVEVKTRQDEQMALAQEAVNFKKQRSLVKSSRFFLEQYNIKNKPMRFDVMAVVLAKSGPEEIRHYKNAFTP